MTSTLKWAKICPPWRGHYIPVNHTKPIQKYKFVVSVIKSFYNAK